MHNAVETFKISMCQVTEVFANFGNSRYSFPELATFEQIRVQSENIMASVSQHRYGNRPDITFVAGQQYPHQISTPLGNRLEQEFAKHLLATGMTLGTGASLTALASHRAVSR